MSAEAGRQAVVRSRAGEITLRQATGMHEQGVRIAVDLRDRWSAALEAHVSVQSGGRFTLIRNSPADHQSLGPFTIVAAPAKATDEPVDLFYEVVRVFSQIVEAPYVLTKSQLDTYVPIGHRGVMLRPCRPGDGSLGGHAIFVEGIRLLRSPKNPMAHGELPEALVMQFAELTQGQFALQVCTYDCEEVVLVSAGCHLAGPALRIVPAPRMTEAERWVGSAILMTPEVRLETEEPQGH